MGCLEQGNPLISRLGGEGVLCVPGALFAGGAAGWGSLGRVRRGLGRGPEAGVGGRVVGQSLGGGHLLPDGAHLLGGFLQRAAIIDNPGCDRLTLLVGCLRGDAGARILLTHAA